jgi:hypothetical protein
MRLVRGGAKKWTGEQNVNTGSRSRDAEVQENLKQRNIMSDKWIDQVVLTQRSPTLYGTVKASAKTTARINTKIGPTLSEWTNLILVINGEHLTEEVAQQIGFIKTHTGYYRYLKPFVSGDRLSHEFAVIPEVTSFHIRLWGVGAQPVLLTDLRLDSEGAEIGFVARPTRRTVRKWESLNQAKVRALAANFLLRKTGCGPECIVHCNKWFESMDGYAARTQLAEMGRDDVYVEADGGELVPASVQRSQPAILELPRTIDDYLRAIGDKSRNMIRKACKQGYEFKRVGPDAYGQDIYEIRTSDPMRQGRKIPEYYYSNPPLYVLNPSRVGCAVHTEQFFGIFKDGRLISYVTLFLFGEMAQVNHLLCHNAHATNGVMNLNVFHMVEQLIANYPQVKYVNYLYIGGAQGGINQFKTSVGFKPRYMLAYDSVMSLYPDIAAAEGPTRVEPLVVKQAVKKSKLKFNDQPFIREKVSGDVMQVVEKKIGRRVARLPMPSYQAFIHYLSRGLSEQVIDWMEGSCFALPFPDRVPDSGDEMADYLSRRFKGSPISDEGFQAGFRGGDFRALGYFQVRADGAQFFRGLLVLEKVTGIGESNVRDVAENFRKWGKAGTQPQVEAAQPPTLAVPKDVFLSAVGAPPTKLDRISLVDDFQPLPDGWLMGDVAEMSFPYSKAIIDVNVNEKFAWNSELPNASVRMWYYSLVYIGRLLATYKEGSEVAYRLAFSLVSDFLDYVSVAKNRQYSGTIASADHAMAERLKVLVAFYQLIQSATDASTVAFKARLLDEIHYSSEWLTDEAHLGVGNHKLMGSMSLIYVYSLLSNESARVYLDTAAQRITSLLNESFDRDGLCNENTIGYHNFNLSLYVKIESVLTDLGVADHLIETIRPLIARATNALQLCIFPDGMIPPIGDSRRYDSKVTSVNRSFCFFESGFAVVKRDDFYLSLICGGRTNWHKHMDDTAIYLQYKGTDVIVDGGSYSYDQANPYTKCITSSAGHSGVFLSQFDGLTRYDLIGKYGPVSGKIERFEERDDGVRIDCAYAVPGCWATFRRYVYVGWAGEVVLVDVVNAPNLTDAVQRFILAPNLEASPRDGVVVLRAPGFEGAMMYSAPIADIYRGESESKVRGWSTYEYGELSAATGIDLRDSSGTGRFSTVIKLNGTNVEACSDAARRFANGTDAFFSKHEEREV